LNENMEEIYNFAEIRGEIHTFYGNRGKFINIVEIGDMPNASLA